LWTAPATFLATLNSLEPIWQASQFFFLPPFFFFLARRGGPYRIEKFSEEGGWVGGIVSVVICHTDFMIKDAMCSNFYTISRLKSFFFFSAFLFSPLMR
jgi:hypothetical protein